MMHETDILGAAVDLAESLFAKDRAEKVDPIIERLRWLIALRFRRQLTYFVRHGLIRLSPQPMEIEVPAAVAVLAAFHWPGFAGRFFTAVYSAWAAGAVQGITDLKPYQTGSATAELSAAALPIGYNRPAVYVVHQIDGTTHTRVGSLIRDGISRGRSRRQIEREVRDTFKGWAAQQQGSRADTIAVDETVRAFNRGMIDLAKAAPGDVLKEWMADPGACPVCLGNIGEAIALEEYFASGDDAPPAHVNCRCSLHLSAIEEA